jgi:hypothetical protein
MIKDKKECIERIEKAIANTSKEANKADNHIGSAYNLSSGKNEDDVKISIFRMHDKPHSVMNNIYQNKTLTMPDNDIKYIMNRDAKSARASSNKASYRRTKIVNYLNKAPMLPK